MKDYNFDEFSKALEENQLVLADFYATWCAPCKMLAPIVEEVANELKETVTVVKVNVDREGALAAQYRVSSIPTLILFKEGKPIDMAIGYRPKDALVSMIKRHA